METNNCTICKGCRKTMKKHKKNIAIIITTSGIIMCLIPITIYNFINNDNFLIIPSYTIINIIIAMFVTYYCTQRKNDERKKKEVIAEIIDKIQECILSDNACKRLSEISQEEIAMMQRRIRNKINFLTDKKDELGIKDEVELINNKFESYCDLIGNHIGQPGHLKESVKEIRNWLDLIDDNLDKIKLKLYN